MPRTRSTARARGITSGLTATVSAALLLAGAPSAAATPTDTVLPVPVAGLGKGLIGQHVTARTDTESPGITRFLGTGGRCTCVVHWRNLSTGATGSTDLRLGLHRCRGTAFTGRGILVATVAAGGAGTPITVLPGAGQWIVP